LSEKVTLKSLSSPGARSFLPYKSRDALIQKKTAITVSRYEPIRQLSNEGAPSDKYEIGNTIGKG
jgi:hypothetical protein